MARTNRKGRSKTSGRFVMLTEELLSSQAYRHLSSSARAMLVEIIRRYDGKNNGYITMSVRQAASLCGCSNRPAMKALDDLQRHGFIKPRMKGAFSLKVRHATHWALTYKTLNGAKPTYDYRTWKPPKAPDKKQKSVSVLATDRLHNRQQILTKKECLPAPGIPNDNRSRTCEQFTVSETTTHIDIYHDHRPTSDPLQHVSALVPEGWRNQIAQSPSGTNNKPITPCSGGFHFDNLSNEGSD
jgi:hypothetical protein